MYFYNSVATYPAATLALSILATVAGISRFNLPSVSTVRSKAHSTSSCRSSPSNPSTASLPDITPSASTLARALSSAASSLSIPAFVAFANAEAVALGTRLFNEAIERSNSSSSRARSSIRYRLRASKGSYCTSGSRDKEGPEAEEGDKN